MLKKTEAYFVGVDIYEDDVVITVMDHDKTKKSGRVQTITGKAAKELYKELTNKKLEKPVNHMRKL